MQDSGCVLFYKPQDTVCNKYPFLKPEDFVLIIMNEGQKEMLRLYGNDTVCLDGTHGTNAYGFELTTLLILNKMREGFPCSFLISNRSDEAVMRIFFSHIREEMQTQFQPKVFMSDMAEAFYNAWLKEMLPAELRLFCTWHIDRAWRKNLNKIDSKDMQVVVYQKLRALMQETDVAAFDSMIQGFLKSLELNPVTSEYANYFKENYLNNVTSWAYCHRLHSGLNTNMHIERMHRTVKYLYLHGKHNKRLDKAISAIIKFVRDKLFEQVITQTKGKLCTKITNLRKRHKTSEELDIESIIATETTWEVPSSSSAEVYSVKESKIDCKCKLLCSACNACLHHYSCSCLDSAIKWNMCKHIHLVCRYRRSIQPLSQTELPEFQSEDNEEENLVIVDESREAKRIPCISDTQNNVDDLATKLDKFKISMMQKFDQIKALDELEAVMKLCAPVLPTIDAVRSARNFTRSKCTFAVPHNKKIIPQRRLYSTKKTRTKPKTVLNKPDSQESNKIALQ